MDVREIRPVPSETPPSAADQAYSRASGRNLGQRAIEIWRNAGQQTPLSPIAKTDVAEVLMAGAMLPVDDRKPKRLVNYEVHFFRGDGTLGLRLFTAAATDDEALSSVGKMQCAEFSAIKVFRGLDHVMVRHRPASLDPQQG